MYGVGSSMASCFVHRKKFGTAMEFTNTQIQETRPRDQTKRPGIQETFLSFREPFI